MKIIFIKLFLHIDWMHAIITKALYLKKIVKQSKMAESNELHEFFHIPSNISQKTREKLIKFQLWTVNGCKFLLMN